MTYHRLAYDDAATTSEMVSDARLAGDTLRMPEQAATREAARERAAAEAAVLADLETLDPARPVVSEDLARMAAGLELHFD
jgi:phage tail sheath gpL-like